MDENADASQAIFIFISRELQATTGVAAHNLDEEHSQWPVFTGSWDVYEAGDLAQNRPLWRLMSLYSTTHSY